MAKFERMVTGNFNSISNQLHQDIISSAMSIDLKEEKQYTVNGVNILFRVYDKYFARSCSRTSLSLQIVGNDGKVAICAIAAGGGNGALFDFSWGAEENMISVVATSLSKMGY